ncbi:MAG: ribosome-associated translation inhibitor RaiA [Gammaproteobacteria bacterium]|nr:ribosome-associated translation inhibitor RaiA [Gammaproteobacteria bacterium]
MQLSISGRHLVVTPALKDYVTSKITRLERHYDHITNVRVVLAVDKLRQNAEAIVHAGAGHEIFADAASHDLYKAIDALSDKRDRQLIRHKETLTSHR